MHSGFLFPDLARDVSSRHEARFAHCRCPLLSAIGDCSESIDQRQMNSESSKGRDDNSVDSVTISIASPETIRSWSFGEVKDHKLIYSKNLKEVPDGLLSECIFGPIKDFTCSCRKYQGKKHIGVVCEKCGVEILPAWVRRERMGHIELAVPLAHIWFFKSRPSQIGLVLNMPPADLERVIYYEDYMVIDPGSTPLREHQLLCDSEYRDAQETYGEDTFIAKMGAEAVRDSLARVDLPNQVATLHQAITKITSNEAREKLAKRIKFLSAFITSKTRPEWMILTVLPVLPPDLRPAIPLEDGGVNIGDLNELYTRVIKRNNSLKLLLKRPSPEVDIYNEKRRFQEIVDAILDNGRHDPVATLKISETNRRPLRSLSDRLKGKSGDFRKNLLGKRVDFSGRSVIVIGPELKLHQCGLPKKMALTLFEPFVVRRLKELGYVHTDINVEKLSKINGERAWKVFKQVTNGHDWNSESVTLESVVWNILDEVVKRHPILLNRAPTLHRLSIQALEPVLVEGDAIRLHPLLCTGYNADFDGDQVAVHIPLSVEAQMEARLLMMAPQNLISPSSGKPIVTPNQDIPLGCYYLTAEPRQPKDTNKRLMIFGSKTEALFAHSAGVLRTHDRLLLANPDIGRKTIYGDAVRKLIETTVGRVMFNEIWPEEIGFYNRPAEKRELSDLIWHCCRKCGQEKTIIMLDKLKELGFREATKAGISIGIADMIIPEESRRQEIEAAQQQVAEVEKQYRKGGITRAEHENRIVDIWTHCTDKVSTAVIDTLKRNHGKLEYNPIHLMVESGARGNKEQVRQLAGLRGLMAKPDGHIIKTPILSNFREGLSLGEFFISAYGGRKGQADRALATAKSGYLTRKLVFVAQDVIIREYDCGTSTGTWVQALSEGEDVLVKLCDRIVGRFSVDDVVDPSNSNKVVVHANEEIDEIKAQELESIGIKRVKIRSVLMCESKLGVCMKCYGRDLARGKLVDIGQAVGIIAGQSIGEPGTQLTMQTFHTGGTASQVFKQSQIESKHDGIIQYSEDLHVFQRANGSDVVLNQNGSISIMSEDGHELEKHAVFVGSVISIPNHGKVKKDEKFLDRDPYNIPLFSEKAGKVRFLDIIKGVTMKQEVDDVTQRQAIIIIEHKKDFDPQVIIEDDHGEVVARYPIPSDAHLVVKEGDKILGGTLLAKIPLDRSKTKDITSGLPRVEELFEARHPKKPSMISKIDGMVTFGKISRGKRGVIIADRQAGLSEEHRIPIGQHIIVLQGAHVEKGQKLTEGPIDPHELLDACGPQKLQEYLVNEVQKVYRLQKVTIDDKHIEIIVRQMLCKVRITEPGGTDFRQGEQIDKIRFEEENKRIEEKGGCPAKAQQVLMSITKASLETNSFLSAAAFQNTTRVLTEAAAISKSDELVGFSENVMIGHLIPAGTGVELHRQVQLKPLVEVEKEVGSA